MIDCDPGIDDAAALLLALGRSDISLVAITTVSGNLTADRCAANALRLLALVGRSDVPVASGEMAPLSRPFPRDPFSHGADGLGDQMLPDPSLAMDPRSAARMIVDMAARHAGALDIVALGPLTNIALALDMDPDLPRRVGEIVMVAGAFGVTPYAWTRATGDNPVSEWNVYVDPEAAQRVFAAGFRIRAFGLDVLTGDDVALDARQQARLAQANTPAAAFIRGTTAFVARRGFRPYCAFIDAMAMAAWLEPSVARTTPLHVAVETKGEMTRGQTVVDRRENFQWTHLPLLDVATSLDARRALDMLLDAVGA
nr:nucleoside hydrolase [Acidomonas methanolica]